MRRPRRWAASLILVACASLIFAAGAEGASSAEENLASAYSPILMLRAQEDLDDPCNTTEEQYSPPTRVEAVLGNPKVTLVHHVAGEDLAVKSAPTAADIAGLGDDYYLDLPRDTLSPGVD